MLGGGYEYGYCYSTRLSRRLYCDKATPKTIPSILATTRLHSNPNLTTPPPRPRDKRPNTSPTPTTPRHRPLQTPVMHHRIIRHHRRHAPAQPLMTNTAHALLRDHHPPIPPRLSTRRAVAQQQPSLGGDEARLCQPGDDAHLVDDAVGAAHAAAEVRLEVADEEGVGDEGESRGGGEAGAVLGEEVEGGREVDGVRGRGGEVEGEEGVVDGGFGGVDVVGGGAEGLGWGGGFGVFALVDAVAVSGWWLDIYQKKRGV